MNTNYMMAASHEGNMRSIVANQQSSGANGSHGHSNLIKSYDASALHNQRANTNLAVGGNGIGSFAGVVQGQNNTREHVNNSALAVSREGSYNRRGPQNASNSLANQI